MSIASPTHTRALASLVLALALGASAKAQPTASGAVTPPSVRKLVPPVYPSDAQEPRPQRSVVLTVTIEPSGKAGAIDVFESGGEAFDRAAIEAVQASEFTPAMRDAQPVASRIHIPFRFDPPRPPPPPPPPPPPLQLAASEAPPVSPSPTPQSPPTETPDPPPVSPSPTPQSPPTETPAPAPDEPEFSASAQAVSTHVGRQPPRASSDFVVTREVIAIAPRVDAGAVLSSAPGVYVSRPEGDAVGHEIFLRGFDAEHGQDIALSAAGIPINQPSHIHGQGYADLNFIPPEVIRGVRVTEGVYDPHQGDFAVAGSVDFDLGVPESERGLRSRTTLGSFGSVRQLLLWAPRGEDEQTFGVVALSRTDGYGDNRGGASGLAMAQLVLGSPSARTTLHASAQGARANLAGVLRYDDVAAGRVGFYDSYDDPSAQAQSAFGSHLQFGVRHERISQDGSHTTLGLWLLQTNFRLRENFTGYLDRSTQMPEWVGRGDLIEQENRDLALGADASYKTPRFRADDWLDGTLEAGMQFRTDGIDQAQNLLEPPQNETWDRRVDASIRGADVGAFVDLELNITRFVTLRGGGRADVLYYDVDDRLGNFIPRFRREDYIVGFRRTALGLALGPRGTLEIKPASWLQLFLSGGRGYRSPQARTLEEGENAPFATVDSAEVGARTTLGPPGRLSLTAAAYRTNLSLDLAFDPTEGRLERVGPTTRQGVALQLVAKPLRWALASVSFTWVHATLDAPPPPTAENPNPPWKRGELLPYVPPIVVRADLGAQGPLFRLAGRPVVGRAGVGASLLSARPLPYGEFSDAVGLLDLALHASWSLLELSLEVTNLLDHRYAASEYTFVSDWATSPTPSLLPARHFAAGPPRTLLVSLGVTL